MDKPSWLRSSDGGCWKFPIPMVHTDWDEKGLLEETHLTEIRIVSDFLAQNPVIEVLYPNTHSEEKRDQDQLALRLVVPQQAQSDLEQMRDVGQHLLWSKCRLWSMRPALQLNFPTH